MNSETIVMDAINVREAIGENAGKTEINEPFTMDDFLKEMEENAAKEFEKMNENDVEENGGETMNREFDVRKAVEMNMEENAAKEFEKMNENDVEENGGETMNREFDVRKAVEMNMEQPGISVNNEIQSTNSFIKIKRIDSDSAYERIKILKNSKKKLMEDINNTDCSGMDSSLINLYNDIETTFDTVIERESLAVASGEQR